MKLTIKGFQLTVLIALVIGVIIWRSGGASFHFILAILAIGLLINLYIEISKVIEKRALKKSIDRTEKWKREKLDQIKNNGNSFETVLTLKLIESQERAREITDILVKNDPNMTEKEKASYLVEFGNIQGFNDGIEWTMDQLSIEQNRLESESSENNNQKKEVSD